MKYVEKLSANDFYNKIVETVNSEPYKPHFLKSFNSFMDKYKNDPKMFINVLTKYLLKILEELPNIYDVYGDYENMSDDALLTLVDFPEDVIRIQKDFSDYGFIISPIEAELIWGERSCNWAASWLEISHNDNTLIEVINFGLICPF